jgi:hypothetical protein
MANYAKTCSVILHEEKKGEHQSKLHVDQNSETTSQIYTVKQYAAIWYYFYFI